MLFHDPRYAQILHYDSVRSKIVQLLQQLHDLWYVSIAYQRVQRDVELLPVVLAVGLDLAHVLEREIHGSLSGREALEAEVYGIGSALEGVEGTLKRPCGKCEFTCTGCGHFFSTRPQMAWNVSGLRSCSTLHASSSAVFSDTPIFMKNCVRTLCLV